MLSKEGRGLRRKEGRKNESQSEIDEKRGSLGRREGGGGILPEWAAITQLPHTERPQFQ